MKSSVLIFGISLFLTSCFQKNTSSNENTLPNDSIAANSIKTVGFRVGEYDVQMIYDDNDEKEVIRKTLLYLHHKDTFLTFSGWECQTDTFYLSDLNRNGIPESWFFGKSDGCLSGIEPKFNADPKIISLERDEEEGLPDLAIESYLLQEPFLLRIISNPSTTHPDTLRYRLTLDGKLYRGE